MPATEGKPPHHAVRTVRHLPWVRRYAAGIDVSHSVVRVVVLSRPVPAGYARRYPPHALTRTDYFGAAALSMPALADASLPSTDTVAAAISAALPIAVRRRGLHVVLGLPPSQTLSGAIELNQLTPGVGAAAWCPASRDFQLDALEPHMVAEAERVSGVERSLLAVDWLQVDSAHPERLVFAATHRHGVDLRVEAAVAAGLVPGVVECEAGAALRACRFFIAARAEARQADGECGATGAAGASHAAGGAEWMAIWLGEEGARAWLINALGVPRQVVEVGKIQRVSVAPSATPDAPHALAIDVADGQRCGALLDALRAVSAPVDLRGAVVAGAGIDDVAWTVPRASSSPVAAASADEAAEQPAQRSAALIDLIADVLGCPVHSFDANAVCGRVAGLAVPRWPAASAVAFGMALRGLDA